jgi:hypothetical protein
MSRGIDLPSYMWDIRGILRIDQPICDGNFIRNPYLGSSMVSSFYRKSRCRKRKLSSIPSSIIHICLRCSYNWERFTIRKLCLACNINRPSLSIFKIISSDYSLYFERVSNCCVNTKSAIYQLYHGEKRLHFDKMMMSALY